MKRQILYGAVLSAVIMIALPFLAITLVKGPDGMAACFLLFYAVDPVWSVLLGIFAGKDPKKLWILPLISAMLFVAGTWMFFDRSETIFLLYAAAYLVLSAAAMLIRYILGKRGVKRV